MAILRPASDIITGGWTSTGASLYTEIDETSASNADYISSSTTGQKCQIALGTTTDPGNDNNHVLRYQAESDGDRGLIARVLETGQPPAIILKRDIWTRQPQVPVGIDWGNPLTRGLVGAWDVSGKSLTGLVGDLTKTSVNLLPTSSGISFNLNGSLSYLTNTENKQATSIPLSFFCIINFKTIKTQRIFDVSTGTTADDVIGIQMTNDASIFAQHYDGATNATTTSHVISASKKYVVCAVFNGLSSRSLYIDGKLINTNTTNVVAPSGINRVTIGYAPWSGTEYYDGYILSPLLFSRALSNSEIKSLSENPWQIFKPKSRPVFIDAPKVIATQTVSAGTIGASYNGTIALTSGEAANITNYANLAVELEST